MTQYPHIKIRFTDPQEGCASTGMNISELSINGKSVLDATRSLKIEFGTNELATVKIELIAGYIEIDGEIVTDPQFGIRVPPTE